MLNTAQFIDKLNKLHPNKMKVLSEYVTTNTPISIECLVYQNIVTKSTPKTLLRRGCTCKDCQIDKRKNGKQSGKKPLTTNEFINKINDDNYSLIGEYKNARTKVTILCKKHNIEFAIMPSMLLRGVTACKCCVRDKRKKAGEISNLKQASDAPAIVYFLYHKPTKLYKLGVTKRGLKRRFGKNILEEFEILKVLPMLETEAYSLESKLAVKYKKYNVYNEGFTANGATEFYTKNFCEEL